VLDRLHPTVGDAIIPAHSAGSDALPAVDELSNGNIPDVGKA